MLKEIRFGVIFGTYPNVSSRDGRMTLELLMQKSVVRDIYPYSVKLQFFDPEPSLPEAIARGGYHFVTLSSINYFKSRHAVHLEPVLILSKTDQPTENLLLLVRKGQTLATIQQKTERTLVIEGGAIGALSTVWIDTVLLESGLPAGSQFFTKIRKVNKPGRAVLPVFFKQADACVTTQDALENIEELNPQIGRQLKSLQRSDGLVRLMMCATKEPTRKDIDFLVQGSINMMQNREAQQTMTIIQMKRFLKIDPKDLAATENLIMQHAKLTQRRTP